MTQDQSTIQLFSYPTSPYAQKVGCYLKYKQLDFKLVPVNPLNNAELHFTRQRQVPVLQIHNQWRKESSELGIWLDELYPERPIVPADEASRIKILSIDNWISDSLIPTVFRRAIEWNNPIHSILNGWKLARAVNNATPLPWYVRLLWPWGVKKAPFIVHMIRGMDLSESYKDRIARLQQEFIGHLADGPFLGGQSAPTLADLSAYPINVSGHLMGMKSKESLLDDPVIAGWSRRVQSHLPENPLLVPDRLLMRAHA